MEQRLKDFKMMSTNISKPASSTFIIAKLSISSYRTSRQCSYSKNFRHVKENVGNFFLETEVVEDTSLKITSKSNRKKRKVSKDKLEKTVSLNLISVMFQIPHF